MTIPSWLKTCAVAGGLLGALALTAGLVAGERNPVRPHPLSAAPAEQARVIVQYKAGAALLRTHAAQAGAGQPLRYAQALAARHGLPLKDGRLLADRMQLVRAQGISSAALAARLAGDPDVEWAVVDGRRFALAAPNDPRYPGGLTTVTPSAGQWYLRANGGEVKASINVESAWSRATGAGQVVAVLVGSLVAAVALADVPGPKTVCKAPPECVPCSAGDRACGDNPRDPGRNINDSG